MNNNTDNKDIQKTNAGMPLIGLFIIIILGIITLIYIIYKKLRNKPIKDKPESVEEQTKRMLKTLENVDVE